jgi:hypothetical protein
MTDYRKMYDKDYVGAWDLPDNKDTTVTITKVKGGELVGLGGRKTKKPVIFLHGTTKGLALNATNGKAIATMYGNHVEEWVGKRISLYKSTTRNPNGDGEVECVRVRPQIPAAKPQAAEESISSQSPVDSDAASGREDS